MSLFYYLQGSLPGNLTGLFINTTVRNITLKNISALFNLGNGFVLAGPRNLLMKQCISNDNNQGLLVQNPIGCTFTDMQVLDNNEDGFDIRNATCCTINNCAAHSNNDIGIFLSGQNNIITNCFTCNNSTAGISLEGTNNSIYRSISQGSTNGFALTGNNHEVTECNASSNTSAGFMLSAQSSQCLLRNNTSRANGSGTNLTNGFGFRNLDTTGANSLYSNFAKNNATNFFGVTNVVTSPDATDMLNFTANIAN